MSNSNNNETFDKQFKKYLRWFIGAIILIFVIFFTLLNVCNGWILNFTWTGPIGDTLGGIMGPFVGILGAGLSFLAFWVQYKANEEQKEALKKQEEQIEKQTRDLKVERFESKFYEMLRLHRANVEEMSIISSLNGREVFSYLFDELKFSYSINAFFYTNGLNKTIASRGYNQSTLTQLAYSLFLHGSTENAKRQTIGISNQDELYNPYELNGFITHLKKFYNEQKSINGAFEYDIQTDVEPLYLIRYLKQVKPAISPITFYCSPFDGHINKLSHYYRHLYYTARLITQQDYLSEEEKEDYIQILSAQLSNYEQVLLYYYSIGFSTVDWEDLFIKYRLIKNLPLSLVDFGENPKDKYAAQIAAEKAKGKIVFEQL